VSCLPASCSVLTAGLCLCIAPTNASSTPTATVAQVRSTENHLLKPSFLRTHFKSVLHVFDASETISSAFSQALHNLLHYFVFINNPQVDFKNDFNRGKVNFVPFLTEPNPADVLSESPGIPEFPSWIILPLSITATVILVAYGKKRER
jgi:hypothetical protein